jgi:hypothetical protein
MHRLIVVILAAVDAAIVGEQQLANDELGLLVRAQQRDGVRGEAHTGQ